MSSDQPSIVLAAFEGWNDAGSAASDALEVIADAWGAVPVASLDAEDFYDFQVNRPMLARNEDGVRSLAWPSTNVSVATSPTSGRTILLVQGIEPSMRWRQYCEEILAVAKAWGAQTLVSVGALLADVPHTRPIPVQTTSEDTAVQAALDLEPSEYVGPVGILSVLAHEAQQSGISTMSIWAAVPHYVAQAPSPKASLALLSSLEEVLAEALPVAELAEDAKAWQRGVDELAEEDTEIAEYVRQLEEVKDTSELPEASGEAIAREFERYLRRRDPGSSR